jgi:probable HAF family extracellular repeat protein
MKTRLVIMIGCCLLMHEFAAYSQSVRNKHQALSSEEHPAPPTYRRTKIDTWVTALNAINDSGTVVGRCLAPPDYFYEYGLRLTPRIKGTVIQYPPADIKMFTEINGNRPFSLNNRGLVAGQTCRPICRATLWLENGVTEVDLGVGILGIASHAYDISDTGLVLLKNHTTTICYVVVPEDTNSDGIGDTWFTDIDGNGINDLLDPVAASLTPGAINDAGRIVFTEGILLIPDYDDTDGDLNPWFADTNADGINDLLYALPAFDEPIEARDINNAGQVVGRSGGRPVLWEFIDGVATITDLGLPGPGTEIAVATAINDAGQIVGIASAQEGKYREGFLVHEGTIYRLDDLMADDSVMHPDDIDINNRGWIIEYGQQLFSSVAIPQP